MKAGLLLSAILVGALLTACGSTTAPAATVTVTATEPAAPSTASSQSEAPDVVLPSPTSARNDRGQLAKKAGESAGATGENGELVLEFTVMGFEFVKCTNEYAGDLNGQALAAHLEVETTADFEGPLVVDGAEGMITFGAYEWKGYEPDGTRMSDLNSDAIQNCMDSRAGLLPDYIGKGEKAKGIVLLDVTSKSGEVVFDPFGDGGWAWKYPEKKANA